MIIDFHTHVYPDKIASRALQYLEEEKGVLAHCEGTLGSLRQQMARNKVDISVVLPIATRPGLNPKLNEYAKSICSDDNVSFGSVYPYEPNWKEQVDYLVELGLKGI